MQTYSLQEQEYGQLLKADIDEAHRRKMETLKDKNPNEIREVYRWMNAVRFADPSKKFRLKRRAVIDEEQREEQQRRDALANGQTLSEQSTSSIESEKSRQSRTNDLNTEENIKTSPSFRPSSF
ncbi:unnamed protein product [Anisakis simplex]|uniref:Uncharacterized protein n=1 Tax=Anisakis simplex TaxID=6269 RepID=A0A0M3JNS5_ANISI|nr:unnamed protein product [Anisakis simplex]